MKVVLGPELSVRGKFLHVPAASINAADHTFVFGYSQAFDIKGKYWATGQQGRVVPKDGKADFVIPTLYDNAVVIRAEDEEVNLEAKEFTEIRSGDRPHPEARQPRRPAALLFPDAASPAPQTTPAPASPPSSPADVSPTPVVSTPPASAPATRPPQVEIQSKFIEVSKVHGVEARNVGAAFLAGGGYFPPAFRPHPWHRNQPHLLRSFVPRASCQTTSSCWCASSTKLEVLTS